MNSGAKGAELFLRTLKMVILFSPTKYVANDDFSEPPRRADSRNYIFIFFLPIFFFWSGSPPGPGVSLGRISQGGRQLSFFLGAGGV